jgi:hypothetical protein
MNFFDIQAEMFMKMVDGASRVSNTLNTGDLSSTAWKILIFDDFTYNIISNFKIGDLREANITLHIHIKDFKEELCGVEAIYFIAPTKNSIELFASDLEKNYFDNIHLNFSGFIEKDLLQGLIKRIIDLKKTTNIKEIKQYNMDFFPLASNIASFGLENSFSNDSLEFKDEIAKKILNLIYVMNESPVIFYDKNSSKLDGIYESLHEQFTTSSRYFKADTSNLKNHKKTLVLLWEGSNDISPYFVHDFKYFPLVVENFNLFKQIGNFNNIKIDENVCHIDLKNDSFWQKNRFEDFPVVLENIYQEVGNWKQKYDKINLKNQSEADIYEMSENFNDALENLPQMTEQNKINQNHTKIASFLMKEVERKSLEKFCVISSEIFHSKRVTKDNLIEIYALFENKEIQLVEKIRLMCVLNYNTTIDIKEYEKLEGLIKTSSSLSQEEISFLSMIKHEKYSQDSKNKGLFEKFKSVSGNILKNVMAESVKCRLSNAVLDIFRKREVDGYKVKALAASSDQMNLDSITQVIIIAVDGLCLKEMDDMKELSVLTKRGIVYVGSQMVTGNDVVTKLVHKK